MVVNSIQFLLGIAKKHDSRLLAEVRTFESAALKNVSQTRKNLQHVSYIVTGV